MILWIIRIDAIRLLYSSCPSYKSNNRVLIGRRAGRCPAAIYYEGLAGDMAGLRRYQEQYGIGHIFYSSWSAHGGYARPGFFVILVLQCAFGGSSAGGHSVDGDV